MEDLYLEKLLEKYHGGNLSAKEKQALNDWYIAQAKADGFVADPLVVSQRLAELHEDFPFTARKIKTVRLWPKIAAAASILLAVIAGGYFYNKGKNRSVQEIAYQNDVAPGRRTATLTLANGRKIELSGAANGDLAKEAGVVIKKTADGKVIYHLMGNGAPENMGKTNTLTTARGETFTIVLPDGSQVSLNAESSLTYPLSFAKTKQGSERRVQLTGEGYFEVAKDKGHPFVVATAKQQVMVLGTHFNINSYADEADVATTLIEGSVKVSVLAGSTAVKSVILKPAEQSLISGGNVKIQKVDPEQALAWKNGLFIFEDEPLSVIMRRVARWYDVEVVYEGADRNELYGGSVSRYDNVSTLLRKLEKTGGIHFKIEGRVIRVMK